MTWRIPAAVVMLAAAAVLALFARDALHWQRAMRDADARAALGYTPPAAWSADTTLPSGLVRRALGIDDDLEFRRVVSQALREYGGTQGLLEGNTRTRAVIESALARLARNDTDSARAAIAADDLGAMFYFDPPTPSDAQNPYENSPGSASGAETPSQKALAQFLAAVRLDPQNAMAQRNLEVLLRGTAKLPKTRVPRAGGGERRGVKGSGSRDPGHGY